APWTSERAKRAGPRPEGAASLRRHRRPTGEFVRGDTPSRRRSRARLVPVNRVASAKVLEQTLGRERCELTVADAAARSGLPLREASEGLTVLAASYAGHLAATSKGELIYQ